jgi:hypothetical protein
MDVKMVGMDIFVNSRHCEVHDEAIFLKIHQIASA